MTRFPNDFNYFVDIMSSIMWNNIGLNFSTLLMEMTMKEKAFIDARFKLNCQLEKDYKDFIKQQKLGKAKELEMEMQKTFFNRLSNASVKEGGRLSNIRREFADINLDKHLDWRNSKSNTLIFDDDDNVIQ